MAAGLIVRDASGVIVTQINDRLTKMLGKVSIPPIDVVKTGSGSSTRFYAPAAANGSIVVPQFATARPFFFFVPNGQQSDYQFIGPSVTISGTTLAWTWKDGSVDAKVKVWFSNNNAYPGSVGGLHIVYGTY